MNSARKIRTSVLGLAIAIAAIATAPSALAATPFKDISSAGPLNHVLLGNELSCQVSHTGDTALEFYPSGTTPGDCGTHLFVDDTLFTPDYTGHGGTATGSLGTRTPFTPVSQVGPTGTGTVGDPFTVVTTVDVGATGLHITQTDTYVVGQESYRSDITITNSGNDSKSVRLWRAGDCFLQGSDSGYGFVNTTAKSVGCSVNANNTPPNRIEEFFPITGGNHYYHAGYSQVWAAIGTHNDFNDTCRCTDQIDNGAGLSWAFDVPGGGSVTQSHFTTFSPTGVVGPPQPAISIDDVSQNEGNSGTTNFVFTVTLDRAPTDTVTVHYQTADGTAGHPGDYGETSGDLTFTPTGALTQTITVPVVGDTDVEPDETFFVNLSAPTNAAITDGQGQGNILNDDSGCVPPPGADPDYCEQQDGGETPSALARAGIARVVVGCPRYRWPRCSGTVQLVARHHGHRVVVGKKSFRKVARTTRRLAKVKLTLKGRRMLRRAHKLRVRVVAVDRVRVGKHRKLRHKRRAIARMTLRARH